MGMPTIREGKPRFYMHRRTGEPRSRCEQLRHAGFVLRNHAPFPLVPPIDWAVRPQGDGNWSFQLNAFYPLTPVFNLLAKQRELEWLQFSRDLFLDWERFHCRERRSHPMAWHDMATGVRATMLAQQLWHEDQADDIDAADMERLLALAERHVAVLANPERFADYNHGLFQMVGIAAICEVLDWPQRESALAYAQDRFSWLFERQFSREGIHLEHSPEYHVLAILAFERILASGLLTLPPEMASRLERAREALPWFTRPDGYLAEMGDTERRLKGKLAPLHPAMAWLTSGGRKGEPPPQGLALYPASGYAAWRFREAHGGESWGLFTVAHHSRVHKHADSFSFEWWDRGVALSQDSGKWGYEKHRPERRYLLSPRAHNVVEVAGPAACWRLPPTRANRLMGEERDGVIVLQGIGTHAHRFSGVSQRRCLVIRPGYWMVVLDELAAWWPRRFRQWFQLPPGAEMGGRDGNGFRVRYPEVSTALRVLSLAGRPKPLAFRGERRPRFNGWSSPEYGRMLPSWQLGFQRRFRRGCFATLLHWSDVDEALLPWLDRDGLCWRGASTGGRLVLGKIAASAEWHSQEI